MVGLHVLGAIAVLGVSLGVQPAGKQPKTPASPAPQNALPRTTRMSNSLGFIFQRGTEMSLETAQEGRTWTVRDGEEKFDNMQFRGRAEAVEPSLRVDRFSVTPDTVIVKVDVSPESRTVEFAKALDQADRKQPPALVDSNGRKYEAVGFVYQDSKITSLRYTKGTPLKGLSGCPPFSRSTADRHLTLIFSVSLGVEIKEFRIGDTVLEKYEPALKCDQPQK